VASIHDSSRIRRLKLNFEAVHLENRPQLTDSFVGMIFALNFQQKIKKSGKLEPARVVKSRRPGRRLKLDAILEPVNPT
jgi:hypothetical protein